MPDANTQPAQLPSAQRVIASFKRASPARRAAMLGGAALVVCTAPYWAPVVWRSKTLRQTALAAAGSVAGKLFV